MALDVNKLRQQEQVQATGNNPAASASTSANNQPIDMTSGTMSAEEKRQKEIEFINSAEFKNCPNEDKAELLKQQFPYLSELSKEDFNKYFAEIITIATTKAEETETTEIETSVTDKTTQNDVDNTSELEQLAEKYCSDNNIENADINDIIAKLATKEQLETLTEDEQKILELYRNNSETDDSMTIELVDTKKYYKTEGDRTVITDEYLLLSVNEQIQVTLQKYLEDSNEDFAQLPDTEKQKILTENYQDLTQIIQKNEEWDNITNQETIGQVAHSLIMTAKHNNLSIQELKNKDLEEIKKLLTNGQTRIKEQYKNMTGVEFTPQAMDILQAKGYMKQALMMSDPSFANLSKEEQQELIDKKLEEYYNKELEKFNADHHCHDKEKLNIRITQELKITLATAVEECRKNKNNNAIEYIDETYNNPKDIDRIQHRINYLRDQIAILPENSPRSKELKRDLSHEQFRQWIYKNNPDFDKLTAEEKHAYYTQIIKDNTAPEHIRRIAEHHIKGHEQARDFDPHTKYDSFDTTKNVYEFKERYNISGSTKTEDILSITKNIENRHAKNEFYRQMMLTSTTVDDPIKFIDEITAAMLADGYTQDEIITFKNQNEFVLHHVASIRSGEDTCHFRHIHGDCNETRKVAEHIANWLRSPEEQAVATKGYMDKYSEEIATGMNRYNTIDQTAQVFDLLGKDQEVNTGDLSIFAEDIIETSTNDNNRLALADKLSDIGNAAILEGIAAGADSVQDKNYRTQYNSVVTQAAQNYPPEVQQTIQTVLSTGEISQGTRTSTEPATNSYYASADTYSDSTSNKSYTSTYTNNNNYSQQTTTYNTGVDYVTTPARSSSNLDITQTIIENSLNTNTQINKTQQTSQQVDITKIKEQAIQNQAEANQKMKDIALENVAEVKQKIDESIKEWELKQELKLSEEIIAEMKEIAASEALEEYIEANPSEKEKVLAKLSNANSISEVYDILLSALGSKVHQKFIENLARGGSSGNIRAFINSKAGNTDVIKQILLRTTSTTLKNELIGMLPPSDVLELLDKNLITTLDNVDHEIIFTYVSKNIYSMTQTNFANYLKYLPFDEREKLIAMRNKAYGVKPEAQQVSIETEQAEVQTNPIAQGHNQAILAQDNNPNLVTHKSTPSAQPQNNKTKNSDTKEFVENPQTKFKAGETTKVLNDGRVITREGTTYAGISDNAEEGFRVVDPKANKKAKEGAPIGMNDEILVPGSQEWLMKYNKQAPKTAFTIAALEDDNQEDGLNFGSNKVKFGQPIKKKYNPNNFNIRG